MSKSNSFNVPLLGAGNLFASMVIAGFVLGYLVDDWLDYHPIFMLAFGGLGIVGGILKAHAMLKQLEKR